MNYFLVLVVIGMAGFAYYQHNQDEQQVVGLQQQIAQLQGKGGSSTGGNEGGDDTTTTPNEAPSNGPRPVLTISPQVKVVAPSASHSSAIDAAANAAAAASSSNSNSLGTVNTLDGRTFNNCKVLKVEADGVTFSHDEGITKVLFSFLPPNVQKQFDYDPQKAVAQTDAQTRYDEQQAAATNAAPSTP